MKKGRVLCANPRDKVVINLMEKLDKKKIRNGSLEPQGVIKVGDY